eukprot:TRINITY_DN4589_c0_g2_i2.p2 TRINITY_DN4589_c0_g2~~TRINITY_DN4589_c0_g2_i2.p2  ORF type:complete len:223 (-),score=30.89 TRINITY_DN4589_c0_g2_i2:51-671(-)
MLSTNFKLGQPQGSAFVRSTPKRVVVRSRVGVGCVKATAVAEEVVPLQQPYGRVFNFSAGPACLPLDILEQVRDDVVSWQGCGMSVMEMSHRGKEFDSIIKSAEADLRQLLSIPDNYQVLFLQGGASTQFSAVPLNLTAEGDSVDQLITGSWSKKAQSEAEKYCNANVAAKGDNKSIPPPSEWKLSENGKYLHYCDNETIQDSKNK